jgi:hypothetical protein
MENLNLFESLLKDFEYIPIKKQNLTIMKVAGYPHYENVASNILAFFLNPLGEHNLNDLLLSSLITASIGENSLLTQNINVIREYPTDSGNRIDLVVQGRNFVIGIENKIFSGLTNDLNDYRNTLDLIGSGKRVVKLVLSPDNKKFPSSILSQNDFIGITYSELWAAVESKLESYIPDSDQKWLFYLLDFMETTKTFSNMTMKLEESDQFFINNSESVERFISEYNKFKLKLARQVQNLKDLLDKEAVIKQSNCFIWVYRGNCLVIEKFLKKFNIAFDLVLKESGWELQLFDKSEEAVGAKFLNSVVKKIVFTDSANTDGRYILFKKNIDEELEQVCGAIIEWFEKIIAAGRIIELEDLS